MTVVCLQVLGIEVPVSQLAAWRTFLAPGLQPFFLSVAEAREFGAPAEYVVSAEQRDTLQLWNVEPGLSRVWLDEQTFAALPKATRAMLVRAQVRYGRGGVPSVRAWSDLLDAHALRTQADGHRFVWWPSLITDTVLEAVLSRFVATGRLSSRHAEVDDNIWQSCAEALPGARGLAGTFPMGSGANCFGTVMAVCGAPGMENAWIQQSPFEDWLSRCARRGGGDSDSGTILVWRNNEGAARHAAIAIGSGWGIEKPSQDWHSPRAVLRVSDIIRSSRVPGLHLIRYSLATDSLALGTLARDQEPRVTVREGERIDMTKNDRIAIASRWTTALSCTGVTPLKALAEVLDDNVRTTNLTGKDAVLHRFKTSSSLAMFRTGTWQEPTVSGDVVTVRSLFHPKAAYHSATLTITVGSSGLITAATVVVSAAPDPLGTVINRVWGPRIGLDGLADHLAATYGVKVKKVAQLDHGVFRIDLAKGEPWIVRLFPSDRPVADVKGDAAVLRFLESKDYPAERCVADVSVHEGQGVLVTSFVKGAKPTPNTANERKFADLIGRLASVTGGPKAVRRAAGGLHLYTVDCTVASEIETARACLQAAAFRGTDKAWEALEAGLQSADDFSTLPKALMHPDPGCANAISVDGGHIVPIDWAGAGYGPRILGIGLLLAACTAGKTFNREWTDAIMGAHTKHVTLTPNELERLEDAIAHRPLIHEAYSWGVGMATKRKPGTFKAWPHDNEGIAKMAAHIRETWA